jgi:hypothetical protein
MWSISITSREAHVRDLSTRAVRLGATAALAAAVGVGAALDLLLHPDGHPPEQQPRPQPAEGPVPLPPSADALPQRRVYLHTDFRGCPRCGTRAVRTLECDAPPGCTHEHALALLLAAHAQLRDAERHRPLPLHPRGARCGGPGA